MATSREIGERIKTARLVKFRSATEAATALGVKYATYAGHENGSRDAKENIELYARRYGVTIDWLLTGKGHGPEKKAHLQRPDMPFGKVPLRGRIAAGQRVEALGDGDVGWVDEPAEVKPETQAVEVSGNSMFPAYEDRTLIYYSRTLPPADMVNRRAVIKLADDSMWVKVLRPGSQPDLWTLQSINSLFPDMVDQVVEWAAPIDWTKPQ